MIVKRDLVRKSSGCTDGVAKFETDCAADLIALSDAVRFDLKVDPSLGNVRVVECFLVEMEGVCWKIDSRGSTTLASKRGWSVAQSCGGENCFRLSTGFFTIPVTGVDGLERLNDSHS